MKIVAYVVSLVLFLGSFALFGYATEVDSGLHFVFFGGGILAVSLALAIPFHLLERLD